MVDAQLGEVAGNNASAEDWSQHRSGFPLFFSLLLRS
jgi:hypothetical protein